MIRSYLLILLLAFFSAHLHAGEEKVTPYQAQKVVYDFYFNEPAKIGPALYWIRSLMNPLMGEPYDIPPDDLRLVVVIHGTEIVTLNKRNYAKYKTVVERMKYYAELGVEFKVCGQAAKIYGYKTAEFYDFVEVVPSAMAELAHWQMQGYAQIIPRIKEKVHTLESIR